MILPAGAVTPCGITAADCPACSAGGLSFSGSSGFYDANPSGSYESNDPFAGLTCQYGNPLSGNTVVMKIDCYQDAPVAQKWYRYHMRETGYPFPDSPYAPANPQSAYWESPVGHRVSPVANWGGDPAQSATFRSAYADWGFAFAGRSEAQITSTTPTDTITQKEATAQNMKRIADYAACFGSFKSGGVQQPVAQQKMIRGRVTGIGETAEYYKDLGEAMDDFVYGTSAEKAISLIRKLEAGAYAGKPLRHVKIVWKGNQDAGVKEKEYITATDADGNFEIPAELIPGKMYRFDVEFTYRKGDTDYFSISDAGVYNVASYPRDFEYNGDADLRQDVDMSAALKMMKEGGLDPVGTRSALYLYDETANAFEFYTVHLKENLDCNLPLAVYPFQEERRTTFKIDTGLNRSRVSPAIVMTAADSSFDNPVHSQYVVYHEFSHYAMYCLYGKKFPSQPTDTSGPVKTVNHGGYMNPSTSDSYVEGFADFMPAVIQEYYRNPLAGTTSGMGRIEDEYKAWDFAGKGEEYAVSGTLWNMYDTDLHYASERKSRSAELSSILADPEKISEGAQLRSMTETAYRDEVTRELGLLQAGQNTFLSQENPVKLKFNEIWPVLRTYHQDFADVYTDFVRTYPSRKSGFDTVFSGHGFYRDTGRGNGAYDPGEPFRPAAADRKTFAPGDPFVDFPSGGFRFSGRETVGPASDYQRTGRTSAEPLPGHFIRTPVDVPVYVVSVEYEDKPHLSYRTLVSATDSLVPVPVPPPGEKAWVVVAPFGVKYERPLAFRSEDFNREFSAAASRGYYLDHDFKVSGPIPARTTARAGGSAGMTSLLVPRGPAAVALEKAGSGDLRALPLLLIPLAGIVLLVYVVRKKE
jgi:hypothetical protein